MPHLKHTLAYRAVAGAIKNAIDGHPDWQVPRAFARSVAKRAAGTLMAHAAPEALAAARSSSTARRRYLSRRPGAVGLDVHEANVKGAPRVGTGRAHLHQAMVAIGRLAKEAKQSRNMVCHHSIVDCLRILAAAMEQMKADDA